MYTEFVCFFECGKYHSLRVVDSEERDDEEKECTRDGCTGVRLRAQCRARVKALITRVGSCGRQRLRGYGTFRLNVFAPKLHERLQQYRARQVVLHFAQYTFHVSRRAAVILVMSLPPPARLKTFKRDRCQCGPIDSSRVLRTTLKQGVDNTRLKLGLRESAGHSKTKNTSIYVVTHRRRPRDNKRANKYNHHKTLSRFTGLNAASQTGG